MGFPEAPRRDLGFQLSKMQAGREPESWKPFDVVGAGTREIRLREDYRVSDVVNEKTAKLTIDTLVEMLSRIGLPVRMAIG